MAPARQRLLLIALCLGFAAVALAGTKEEFEKANPHPPLEALPTVTVRAEEGREIAIRVANGTAQDLVYDAWTISPVFHWEEKANGTWSFLPSPVCSMSWTAQTLPAGQHLDFLLRLSPHEPPATAYLRLRTPDGGKASFVKIYEFQP